MKQWSEGLLCGLLSVTFPRLNITPGDNRGYDADLSGLGYTRKGTARERGSESRIYGWLGARFRCKASSPG